MAAATGKNKLERQFRVLWDNGTARDLSGDLVPGSMSGGGFVFDEVEMTGVSEAVKNYLSGHAEADIGASFRMNDTATTGSHTVLNADAGGPERTMTLQWGSDGAPQSTDIEWEGTYILVAYGPMTFDGGNAVMPCTFKVSGATPPAFGTVA